MIHVMPVGDLREHEESDGCPCGPDVRWGDEDGPFDECVVIHRSWDGREVVEEAEALIRGVS